MSLGLRTTGRAPADLTAEVVAEITAEDLAVLNGPRSADSAPRIVKLRERHHALARLLAEGKTPGEAALISRYSQSRISILQGDPAFQELVAHYRRNVEAEFIDFQKKLSELSTDALLEIQDRLEESPEEMSDQFLLRVVEMGADRTGHGPSAKQEMNIRIGLADRLRDARERSEAVRQLPPSRGLVIEGTTEGDKPVPAPVAKGAERPRPASGAERPHPAMASGDAGGGDDD